jgi:hypothetical protein
MKKIINRSNIRIDRGDICENTYCTSCNCKCIHPVSKNKECKHTCKNPINLLDNLDDKLDYQTDVLQHQINLINECYTDIINDLTTKKKSTEIIINEINQINDTLEEIITSCCSDHNCHCDCEKICESRKIIYTDPNNQHIFIVKPGIKFIFITAVGGGGAGGLGIIKDMYYYSGGGGGSGASIINKPISVVDGTILYITVGKGGDILSGVHGGETIIKITYPNSSTIELIIVDSGKNGNPSLDDCDTKHVLNVDGGAQGNGVTCLISGNDGMNGNVSVPSFLALNAGSGGDSIMYAGGRGAGNTFADGGEGGHVLMKSTLNNDTDVLIGKPGKYGSGGGGSAAKSFIDKTKTASGYGGDGLVIIEW